ncbi:ATP-binding protein [Chengkuizengella sp. SCS-71B]|uniref:ATP-binding protein n=1 Tax=Chengkuizengella sp. SCS-71B TaxID=3115290 RepID=UPI0032C21BBC
MGIEPYYLTESKNKCKEQGMDPKTMPKSTKKLTNEQLKQKKATYEEILSIMGFYVMKIIGPLKENYMLIVITDDEGYILDMFGDVSFKSIINNIGITNGVRLCDQEMGTNSVDIALNKKHPIQIIGSGHFHHALHQTACYSVPFYFSESHFLSGTISIMTSIDRHNPYLVPLLSSIVDSIERELLLKKKNDQLNLFHNITINTIRDGVIITNKYGRITEINPFVEDLFNRSKEDLLENSIFDLDPFGKFLYDVLENQTIVQDHKIYFDSLDNKTKICLLDALPIFDDNNELIGSFANIRDITEKYNLEKQVILSEKFSAIGKLAAGLAHEIRNPLTSIMGFTHLLKQKYTEDESEEKYMDIISEELTSLNEMVSQFVLMAKPSSPEFRLVNIQSLIQDTVKIMRSQAILKNIAIEEKLLDHEVNLLIDSAQIKQVFINLIQNAIEAMDRNGTIQIIVKQKKDFVIIDVVDEGKGISEKEMNQILNPFFSTKDSGLGLGLSISYRILNNHNAKIDVSSKLGSGTTFTLRFPDVK